MGNTFLDALENEQNVAYTGNGAVSLRTSGSECVDLFGTVGGMRGSDEGAIQTKFMRAWAEDPDVAIKILFYARDVRGGLGERRIFRTALKWLADTHPESVFKNIELIPEYGRWDDLLTLFDTECEDVAAELIRRQFVDDMAGVVNNRPISLLAKWLPSINASSATTRTNAKKVARALGVSDAIYRKSLSVLRKELNLTENYLREKDYTFDYSKVPSRAGHVYRGAFLRNDEERYVTYLESVNRGEAKINTATLFPYDIVDPYIIKSPYSWLGKNEQPGYDLMLETEWANLEDFTDGKNALVVMDGSGSMYGGGNPRPISVAMSLAIYYAERNKGACHGKFITFSETPKLVTIKGQSLHDRVRYCESFNEVANTNIQAVFELILRTAVSNKIAQDEMPEALYIISDMEFDYCTSGRSETNFEYAKRQFGKHGYKLPQVVFWNVASRTAQVPVKQNEQGVVLVSGCTPRIFVMLQNNTLNPYDFMIQTLESERYKDICA